MIPDPQERTSARERGFSHAPPSGRLVYLQAALDAVSALGRAAAPWIDAAARLWLAEGFLEGAAMTAVMHHAPAMASAGHLARGLNHIVASPLGFAVQTLCPLLLMGGLLTRLAAIPLLIQLLLLHGLAWPAEGQVIGAALLGWTIVSGPGGLSLDALLGHGVKSIALAGAGRLADGLAVATRVLQPWAMLLLRMWTAAALLAGLPRLGFAADRLPMVPWWLVSWPSSMDPRLATLAALAGLLLAVGLGMRGVALVLLLIVQGAAAGMTLDHRAAWLLLLGLLAAHGPGPISGDALIRRWLAGLRGRRPEPVGLPHVVIVGGGFGGLAAARGLADAPCRITLVDQRNYTLFQPLLYQVATGGLSPADIATPIRSLFRGQPNLRVLLGHVTGVSLPTREIVLDRGRLSFDWLVLATGSEHSYFGRSEWAPWAPGLKRVEDATDIRRRLLTAFERAEDADSPAEQAGWLTFVIVGGGPTGVELAGAIAELARHGLSREFRAIDPGRARVLLVQSASRLLPTFPEPLSGEAAAELGRIGVEVRLGARVEAIDEEGVTVSGERIAARTVLWAAGVMASPVGDWLAAPVDRAGRVVVGPDLSVAPHETVFAVGDTAASTAWAGQAVPGLAPAAKQAGAYVAAVIGARLRQRPPPPPFRYHHAGSLATIGRRSAVAALGRLRVRGALAWWFWGAVHIAFLAGGRNRLTVLLDWTWAYATYRSSTRLITDGS